MTNFSLSCEVLSVLCCQLVFIHAAAYLLSHQFQLDRWHCIKGRQPICFHSGVWYNMAWGWLSSVNIITHHGEQGCFHQCLTLSSAVHCEIAYSCRTNFSCPNAPALMWVISLAKGDNPDFVFCLPVLSIWWFVLIHFSIVHSMLWHGWKMTEQQWTLHNFAKFFEKAFIFKYIGGVLYNTVIRVKTSLLHINLKKYLLWQSVVLTVGLHTLYVFLIWGVVATTMTWHVCLSDGLGQAKNGLGYKVTQTDQVS